MMESEVMGNYHASFGERDGETRTMRIVKVRTVPTPLSPLLALIALHGMDEAITQLYPDARVIAYADDCLVLHPNRATLDHCQQLLTTWLAKIGLTLNVNKTHMSHTLEGDQPGVDFLGFTIRQYRVGK